MIISRWSAAFIVVFLATIVLPQFSTPARAGQINPFSLNVGRTIGPGGTSDTIDLDEHGSIDGTQVIRYVSDGFVSRDATNDFINFGDYSIKWEITVDPDPFVNAFIAVINNAALNQQFTISEFLNITPAISPASLTGGSMSGSVTGPNGATMMTVPGSQFYMSIIDNVDWQPLYTHSQSFAVAAGQGSVSIPFVNFGAPIPSLAGPTINTNIGIVLDFVLTPGALGSITSRFEVIQIPIPATAWAGLSLLIVFAAARYYNRHMRRAF